MKLHLRLIQFIDLILLRRLRADRRLRETAQVQRLVTTFTTAGKCVIVG